MADEQPNTPSAEPSPSTDAEVSAAVSEQTEERPSKEGPSWWQRLTRRQAYREEAPSEQEPDAGAEPGKVVLTQEELDRRIQAETDRRAAKKAAEDAARQRRELRDKDPWEFAKQERQAEELQVTEANQMQFFAAIGSEFDKVSIDPIFERLPEEERKRILGLEGAQHKGLDGRKFVVSESMKALEKHWKAEGAREAESRLRRNPAFRKQVLGEARGQAEEPELIPGVGSSNGADHTVSTLLRDFYKI